MSDTETSAETTGETIVYGACQHDCPDNCAMESVVRDGRVISVRGRHDHPFTHGVLCAKVRSFEKRMYAPDRILHPLRRSGPKGAGQFERITWDEALGEIATRFRSIIAEHGAETILPFSYLGSQGLLNGLHCGDRFFNRLGAAVAERTFCNSGATKAFRMVCGPTGGLDPESFAHSKLIILWGINIISTAMHHWRFVKDAMKAGATLVVIDPLRSRTAARADWHIRPRPGTDVALALALIHQIVEDGAVDAAYVADHTLGFEELKARAAQYPPARAAAITGVPEDEIVKLARTYASTHPSAIRTGVALERTRNGPDAVRAVACLPALTGAWRHVGGGMFQHPQATFPIARGAITRADLIEPGRRAVNVFGLADALKTDADPPVKALFVYNANPLTAPADQEGVVRGLLRDDLFTVVSEIFPSDATDYADIVLPAASQLEQWDLMFSWGHFSLQLNKPAVAPVGEAVSNAELFRRLARAMGMEDADLRRSDRELMEQALDWDAPQLEGITLDGLMETGYAKLKVGASDERLPHAEGGFPTPSGKVEFASSMADEGGAILEVYRQGWVGGQEHRCSGNGASSPCHPVRGAARSDAPQTRDPASDENVPVDPVPDYREPDASDHPFTLLSPKTHHFLNSGYTNLNAGSDVQPVWIHPDDAEGLGIADGDTVRVFNHQGEVRATAKVTDDTLPGVVVITHGFWRRHVGGPTVNTLVSHKPAAIGQAPTINDAKVAVARV